MTTDHALNVRYGLIDSVVQSVKVGTVVLDHAQRIVLWNRWMEDKSRMPSSAVIGKLFTDAFPDMINGRTHAAVREALENNFPSLISQTLNKAPFPLFSTSLDMLSASRMQQAVQVIPIDVADLPRHCLIQIIDVSTAVLREKQLREQSATLKNLSYTDGLTGIPNRRRFNEFIELEYARASRCVSPLSLFMIDIDFFKAYNDTYGHQKGDQCLTQVANTLAGALQRPTDLLARYGGEEFVALLPDTDAVGALGLAQAMRAQIEKLAIAHSSSGVAAVVTVSIGVVTKIPERIGDVTRLIHSADLALYEAKRAGRNRISVDSAL